jgi:hypothetical protein
MSDEKKTEELTWERLPMTCRHSPEGIADADQVIADLTAQMSALGYTDISSNFLSCIVSSLEHDLDGWEISFLACDQWFGASIKREGYTLSTEGDTAEDCLAQLWLRAAEITPPTTESVPSPEGSAGSHSGTSAENPAP